MSKVMTRSALACAVLALALFSGPSTKTQPGGALRPGIQSLMALYAADIAGVDRNMRDYKFLDQIQWQSRPNSASQTATVFGDPTKPGMYVTLLKRGPDDWSQPHAHQLERFITVLKGTMLIGTGPKFDKNATVAVPAGGMIHDIAGQMHYDGTGPDGLIIEVIGMGPAGRL